MHFELNQHFKHNGGDHVNFDNVGIVLGRGGRT